MSGPIWGADDSTICGSGRAVSGLGASFVVGNPTDTLALLKDLSTGVSGRICYQSRDDEGTQSPIQI